jgi:hypothetical protein
MANVRRFVIPESPGLDTRRDRPPADALTAAIRKPIDALDAAAEEAAKGMLGAAKLGLLVAANGIIDALKAIDAEFERRYATRPAGSAQREADRHEAGV